MIPPYLHPEDVSEDMRDRPDRPFFLRPRDYRVIDGDTLEVLTAPSREDGRRKRAFRIRFATVNAPEIPKPSVTDAALKSAGLDPHAQHIGRLSALALADLCKGRCLLVLPEMDGMEPRQDRFLRLLAKVAVSGAPGPLFDLNGAFDVERRLFDMDRVRLLPGRSPPPSTPVFLEVLRDDLEERLVTRRGGDGPTL